MTQSIGFTLGKGPVYKVPIRRSKTEISATAFWTIQWKMKVLFADGSLLPDSGSALLLGPVAAPVPR